MESISFLSVVKFLTPGSLSPSFSLFDASKLCFPSDAASLSTVFSSIFKLSCESILTMSVELVFVALTQDKLIATNINKLMINNFLMVTPPFRIIIQINNHNKIFF